MLQIADDQSRPTPLAKHAGQQYRLLRLGVIVLLMLACAYQLAFNMADPDLWGHVRYGQEWIAAGEMPRTATHTYTAVDYPWINHENLAELLFASSYDSIGIYWTLVAKCLLGMSILAAMAWLAVRQGVSALSAWAFLFLVAVNLEAFFPLRPQLLSFVWCGLALVCLDRGFEGWTERQSIRFVWLWPLPAIMIAWVNSHGGFLAGLCIVGAVLLGRMIELMIRQGRSSLTSLAHLALIGLACLAATAANPYGLGMHQWLWNSWGGAPPEITEWAPPLPGTAVFWPLVALVAAATFSLLVTQQKRDWTQIVVLTLVAWQASLHLRHIAFVALLCGFWVPVHWHSALQRLRPSREGNLPVVLPPRWFRLAMATAVLVGIVFESVALAGRLGSLPVQRSKYPVDALQFMVDHGLTGRTVVSFNWAQYALAALGPETTVGFDGRFDTCYPQEAIDVHFDFLLGGDQPRDRAADAGPIDGFRVLRYGQPDLVLVDREFANATAIMRAAAAEEDPKWTLLYSDAVAELWGRRSRFDDPANPDYFPVAERRFNVPLLEASFQWPALPDWSLTEKRRSDPAAERLTEQ